MPQMTPEEAARLVAEDNGRQAAMLAQRDAKVASDEAAAKARRLADAKAREGARLGAALSAVKCHLDVKVDDATLTRLWSEFAAAVGHPYDAGLL